MKDEILKIRIDSVSLEAIKARAEKNGQDVSAFVRDTLRAKVLSVADAKETPQEMMAQFFTHMTQAMEILNRLGGGGSEKLIEQTLESIRNMGKNP